MITYIDDVGGRSKIEVTFDSQEKLPEPPTGFEWIDISSLDDYARKVCVFLLVEVME